MESILTSIKKLLGITEEYEHFDADIIMHINSVFMVLNQLGVGPAEGFYIEDDKATWDKYLTDPAKLQMVKSYIYLKVRLLFDPPVNGTVINSMKEQINEFEWRLNIAADPATSSIDSATDNVHLKDRTTNIDYELYVDNGNLMMDRKKGK